MRFTEFTSTDACPVCGQTPCNCTHVNEEKVRLDPKCWTGKKIGNPKTKIKGGVRVNNCVPAESVEEGVEESWTKLPSGDYQNSHTGVRSSKPPVKKKRSEKTGAEWDAIKAKKEQGVAKGSFDNASPMAKDSVKQDRIRSLKNLIAVAKEQGRQLRVQELELELKKLQGVAENFNPEYDDEAGMADNNLETLRRAVDGIDELIQPGDNLPEWCQEKIAQAKGMLVGVWDYMKSEQDRGATAELAEEFDMIERIIEGIAAHNGVDAEAVWTDLESLTEDELYAFAVTSQLNEDWSKVNKRDKTDGMSRKAVNAYRREHPGSKLQTAVTTKPSKLKKGSKASKRRKSYCSRSRGQMKMHNISCAKTPDKAICKARRRWNC